MRHGAPQVSRGDANPADRPQDRLDHEAIWLHLQAHARELGFSQIGVSDVSAEPGFLAWLAAGFAGTMSYMSEHGLKRMRPAELVPGTVRVITARMDYLAHDYGPSRTLVSQETDWRTTEWSRLGRAQQATISLYARGRDYHKVLRHRLARLADGLQARIGPFGHRAFTDSAPVAEVELAQRSGLGWRGKHTLLLDREGGSMFFLGELFVDLPLKVTPSASDHCGQCSACLQVCPTAAIVAPYRLDARRCISYLTIEHAGPIDPALRPLMGNRIYGCDDCQLACPWNKYAQRSALQDFQERPALQDPELLELWGWTEQAFLHRTEGSAIRRIGYERWRRNLAVALGNGLHADASGHWAAAARAALVAARDAATPMVREHIDWALAPRAST
ncbi:MAG: tRNA epoxyqueuosine(34) reductase QueG [Betaproteobacteria bacterium]|nr:tRNA epoxyqueuosine(34) reductase QueG [Betaproteobacteria bacterium]